MNRLDVAAFTDEQADRIEERLFAAIARERSAPQGRRERSVWLGVAAAAAFVVVAAVIGHQVTGVPSSNESGAAGDPASSEVVPAEPAPGLDYAADVTVTEDASALNSANGDFTPSAEYFMSTPSSAAPTSGVLAGRQTIQTGSAVLFSSDVPASAQAIIDAAEDTGGYVESITIGSGGQTWEDTSGTSPTSPQTDGDARAVVRIPAESLTETMAALRTLGEVSSSSMGRDDVTETAVDYRARVFQLQESVSRLQELMAQAGSVNDLLAAEGELSARQAELESYQQQVTSLSHRAELATLTVIITPEFEPVATDPAGFTDGLATGISGLTSTLNGIVVGVGFLLPWLGAVGLVLVLWLAFRLRQDARRLKQ